MSVLLAAQDYTWAATFYVCQIKTMEIAMHRMNSSPIPMRRHWRMSALSMLAVSMLVALPQSGASAANFTVHKQQVPDFKAVFGQIESRNVLPARARIGGTLESVTVTEGSKVTKGQQIALVVDPKIALQLQATDATIKQAMSQLDNAQKQFDRTQELLKRGISAQATFDQSKTQLQVAQNQVAVAQSSQKVLQQSATDGAVLAPADGRVLTVPVSAGSVIMPGEIVARIASGPYYLRLSLPERMAPNIHRDAKVRIGSLGILSTEAQDQTKISEGTIVKVYPEITGGRVTADVSAVPPAAIVRNNGIDYVNVSLDGVSTAVAVIPGSEVTGPNGPEREILTGLHDGDEVVIPEAGKSGL